MRVARHRNIFASPLEDHDLSVAARKQSTDPVLSHIGPANFGLHPGDALSGSRFQPFLWDVLVLFRSGSLRTHTTAVQEFTSLTKPLRVLQVLYRADRGGAETWLLHVLRHINRDQIAMDFLVHDKKPGAYDAEITARGARIFICSGHRNLLRQWYGLWRLQH